MDEGKLVAELLHIYGGWGVSVVFLGMIAHLYRTMNSLLEKRNDQFIAVLKEGTAILQQNSEKSERVEEMLRAVAKLMETVEHCVSENREHIMAAEKTMREVEKQMEINRFVNKTGQDGR